MKTSKVALIILIFSLGLVLPAFSQTNCETGLLEGEEGQCLTVCVIKSTTCPGGGGSCCTDGGDDCASNGQGGGITIVYDEPNDQCD